jgi:hypothetical protein
VDSADDDCQELGVALSLHFILRAHPPVYVSRHRETGNFDAGWQCVKQEAGDKDDRARSRHSEALSFPPLEEVTKGDYLPKPAGLDSRLLG